MNEYPPPVAALLSLGRDSLDREHWLDYRAKGIGPEHVPDLMRMLLDRELHEGDSEGTAIWAPLHAGRALGQLRAVEAAEALVRAVREDLERDGDFVTEDMPDVFALLGPATLPVLAATLRDTNENTYVRWATADSIKKIAQQYPETRAEAVALLVGQLHYSGDNDPGLNGGLVSCLLDLKATEAAGVIERAYEAGNVEEFIVGRWEDVRYELGLGPPPPPRTRPFLPSRLAGAAPRSNSPKARAQERSRKKKKQAKQNRKKK